MTEENTNVDVNVNVDVAVVGGGLSGLAAALTLVRARRTVVVIDAGHPRNAPAAHSHGYLTRDGASPLELLRMGRLEVRGYGGTVAEGTSVESIERLDGDGLFRITTDAAGTYRARRVLVTTGLVDEYPDVPGLRERWGRDVVHCPYCFGWELRDRALGILATRQAAGAVAQALMWHQWSSDITLFLHTAEEPSSDDAVKLAARGVDIVRGEVAAVEIADDRIAGIRLASGQLVRRDAVVIGPRLAARHGLLDKLGVEVIEHPLGIGHQVNADGGGFTGVPGIWVAGNVADVTAGVMQAAASGVSAAAALNADLTAEDVSVALREAEAGSVRST